MQFTDSTEALLSFCKIFLRLLKIPFDCNFSSSSLATSAWTTRITSIPSSIHESLVPASAQRIGRTTLETLRGKKGKGATTKELDSLVSVTGVIITYNFLIPAS